MDKRMNDWMDDCAIGWMSWRDIYILGRISSASLSKRFTGILPTEEDLSSSVLFSWYRKGVVTLTTLKYYLITLLAVGIS